MDQGNLTPLPGATKSTQFLGDAIADPGGKLAGDVVMDLLWQLCEHTMHLGGDFDQVLADISRHYERRTKPHPC
jgi:hypothetical protein